METSVDWRLVCLVCLQEEDLMRSVYDEDSGGIKLSDKIMKCANIDVNLEPNFPEQICASCSSDLTAAYRFHINCENSLQILKSLFVQDNTRIKNEYYCNKKQSSERIDSSSLLLTPKKRYKKDVESRMKSHIEVDIIPEGFEDHLRLNNITEEIDEDIFPNLSEFLKKKESSSSKKTRSSNKLKKSIRNSKSKVKESKKCTSTSRRKSQRVKNENSLQPNLQSKQKVEDAKSESESLSKLLKIEVEKLVCEVCGNTYKHANALRVHMLRHENVRQFKCELCPKAFVADTDLKRHMRVHTGEKPYACRYCDRRFSDFGSRGKHERIHTGERPYKCTRCNKSFSYSHVLNVHQLVHTGIKKFKCDVCEKGFTKKLYLDNHMKNHVCEVRYEIREVANSANKIDENNTDKVFEPDSTETSDVQISKEIVDISGHQKSVFTLVKTESGLAEVQYYLPVLD